MKKGLCLVIALSLMSGIAPGWANEDQDHDHSGHIKLPEPRTSGGMPVLTALKNRHTSRDFSEKELPLQTLSDLLWAGFGINRPEYGMRTAPSSYNWQDVMLYVFLNDGVYLYNAEENRLDLVKEGDHRRLAGLQGFVKTAPLSIVYVSDTTTMVQGDSEFSDKYKLMVGCIDAGHISQNIYLFGASEGLGVVARGSVDRDQFAEAFDLPDTHNVIFGQTVGYVNEEE